VALLKSSAKCPCIEPVEYFCIQFTVAYALFVGSNALGCGNHFEINWETGTVPGN
jgi:hypothetical protein